MLKTNEQKIIKGENFSPTWSKGKSKITAHGDCSHEIKRCLLLGREVMINLDSILKSRDITLPTKVRLVKATVFPVVMYGCESWTIKKPESWRIDAFELWCWRILLKVFWTARRSNQSIPKKIIPEYSVERVRACVCMCMTIIWVFSSFKYTWLALPISLTLCPTNFIQISFRIYFKSLKYF